MDGGPHAMVGGPHAMVGRPRAMVGGPSEMDDRTRWTAGRAEMDGERDAEPHATPNFLVS